MTDINNIFNYFLLDRSPWLIAALLAAKGNLYKYWYIVIMEGPSKISNAEGQPSLKINEMNYYYYYVR